MGASQSFEGTKKITYEETYKGRSIMKVAIIEIQFEVTSDKDNPKGATFETIEEARVWIDAWLKAG